MNVTAPQTVADRLLPRLVALVLSRKQARWQWANCAGEHEHKWVLVIERLDWLIAESENYIAGNLELFTFRTKREIVE